jgi:ubiquinone/menaquinone biosynthesis C-methylase UbiE
MLNKMKAWIELFKLGSIGNVNQEVTHFYRGNVVNALNKEGFFEFLDKPHSVMEIASHFNYTDHVILDEMLTALTRAKLVSLDSDLKYKAIRPLKDGWVKPRLFNDVMVQVLQSFGNAIPDRLRGKYHAFSSGLDLYNWDDTLSNKVYTQMRKCAVAYAGIENMKGKFLDVGCGNGYSTAAIWAMYAKKGMFHPGSPMRFVGIDPDDNLLNIAQEEFSRFAAKHLGTGAEEIETMNGFYPEFKKGYAEKIPAEDNTFDMVFINSALHWTQADKAIKEMVRVTKPKGIVFGTVRLFPHADYFADLHTKVAKDASGFFYKGDFKKWAIDAGASKVNLATIVSVFKITK